MIVACRDLAVDASGTPLATMKVLGWRPTDLRKPWQSNFCHS